MTDHPQIPPELVDACEDALMASEDATYEAGANDARIVLAAALAFRDASGVRVLYLAEELEQVGWEVVFEDGEDRHEWFSTDEPDNSLYRWVALFRLPDPVEEPAP